MRYVNTGTNWERHAFAQTIATRASTAENLSMGDQARGLKDAFIEAFIDAEEETPAVGDGKGSKERDRALLQAPSDFDRAKTFFFGQLRKTSRDKAAEGTDYFATPEPLGLKMVEWADIRPTDAVLEPSAGHGAIARWFPELNKRTAIEPSFELSSRLALVTDAKVLMESFEDHNIVNKYGAIVMNPPFGHGGKTAIEHLQKAYRHLTFEGRIVAVIPKGPAMDKRFDEWLYGNEEKGTEGVKGLYLTADIDLPRVTFSRAGTEVSARIVVLDRVADPKNAPNPVARDYSNAETFQELFDRIEDATVPDRPIAKVVDGDTQTGGTSAGKPTTRMTFVASDEVNTKTKQPIFYARPQNRVSPEEYRRTLAIARKWGGYWSPYQTATIKPGFAFNTTAEDRDGFLAEMAAGIRESRSATQRAAERWAHQKERQKEAATLAELKGKNSHKFSDGGVVKRDPKRDNLWVTQDGDLLTDSQLAEVIQDDELGPALRESRAALQTSTPEFKRWFGNSKVVDKYGRPLRVYHGTMARTDFEVFDQTVHVRGPGHAETIDKVGSWFSTQPKHAELFAGKADHSRTIPVYLSLQNPFVVRDNEHLKRVWRDYGGGDKNGRGGDPELFVTRMANQGYDGLVMHADDVDRFNIGGKYYVAFDTRQIKSAIGNQGTFNPEALSIRESRAALQTSTPEFKRWFGDSKIVDAEGNPRVVYHGTADIVDAFDLEHPNRKDTGWLGIGVYLQTSPRIASAYSNLKAGNTPNVMPLYARVEKPYYATIKDKQRLQLISHGKDKAAGLEAARAWTRELQAQGYDGVILEFAKEEVGDAEASLEIVVFDRTGVKSASGNRGTFGRGNPDIRESRDLLGNDAATQAALSKEAARKAKRRGEGREDIPPPEAAKPSPTGDLFQEQEQRRTEAERAKEGTKQQSLFDARLANLEARQQAVKRAHLNEQIRARLQQLAGKVPRMRPYIFDTEDEADRVLLRTGQRRMTVGAGGAYQAGSDNVYFVVGNHPDIESAERVFAHEFAHYAMDKYGETREALRGVKQLRQKGGPKVINDIWAFVDEAYAGLPLDDRAHEVLAVMAEQGIEHPILDQLIRLVKRIIRQIGIDLKFSEAEIRGMIAGAMRRARSDVLEAGDFKPTRMSKKDMQAEIAAAREHRGQWDLASFKRWFGNSKVVDNDGNPLRVYHGSPYSGIEAFSKTQARTFYFSSVPATATSYAEGAYRARDEGETLPIGATLYPVYLSMQNPLEIDADGAEYNDIPNQLLESLWQPATRTWKETWSKDVGRVTDVLVEWARKHGHDGVIFRNIRDDILPRMDTQQSTVYAAFRPEQVKSATGNTGNFVKDSPYIRESRTAPKSQAFNKWFGTSVVVDRDGEPEVMYHATREDFDEFKQTEGSHFGFHFGNATQARANLSRRNKEGDYVDSEGVVRRNEDRGMGLTMPVYLSIKNPLRTTDVGDWGAIPALLYDLTRAINKDRSRRLPHKERQAYVQKGPFAEIYDALDREGRAGLTFKEGETMIARHVEEIKDKLEQLGYDGIVYKNRHEGTGDSYIALRSEQIKSASGNRGTFDPRSPSLRESRQRGPVGDAQRATVNGLRDGISLDVILRLPWRVLGLLDEHGEFALGGRISDKLAHYIRDAKFSSNEGPYGWMNIFFERARWALLDKYGVPLSAREQGARALSLKNAMTREGMAFANKVAEITEDSLEAEILGEMLNGDRITDERFGMLPVEIRAAIERMSLLALELGHISRESYERNKGTYMHRVYMDTERGHYEGELSQWMRGLGRKHRIKGDELKGRGAFWDVTPERLLRDIDPTDTDIPGVSPLVGGVKKQAGLPDPSFLGRKFRVLDMTRKVGEGTAEFPGMEKAEQKERVVKRIYWPLETAVPAKWSEAIDRGTFEVRRIEGDHYVLWRDYTKEERIQRGEILDARYTIAKTYQLMGNDIANGKYFLDLSQNPEATWQDSGPPPAETIADSKSKMMATVGYEWIKVSEATVSDTGGKKKWGALAGRYVRVEVWKDLQEYDRMSKAGTWQKLLDQWKLNKTARNPVVHANNTIANMWLADLIDVRVRDVIEGFREYVRQGEIYKQAEDHGTFGHGFADVEMHALLKQIFNELEARAKKGKFDGVEGKIQLYDQVANITSRAWHFLKKADDWSLRAYSAEDDIFRMAAYMRGLRQGLTPQESASRARREFLDYDIRAPWINNMRSTVFPFIAYTYRAVPVIADAMLRRPWKMVKYVLLFELANALAYAVSGGDEEEERRHMPDQDRGRTWMGGAPYMIRLPVNDKYGRPMFMDIRRWIPAGDIYDINTKAGLGIPTWLQFGGPLMIAAELTLNRAAFTGQDIVNPRSDDFGDKQAKRAEHVWRSWMPSAPWIYDSWYYEKIAKSIGGKDVLGRPYSTGQALLSSTGVKVRSVDTKLNATYSAEEFERTISAIRSEMRAAQRQYKRGLISKGEFEDTRQEVLDKIRKARKARKERLTE
jgi:hypothetical protein